MSAPHPNLLPFYLHSNTSAGAGGGDEDPNRKPYRLKSAHEADVPDDQKPYEEAEAGQSSQAKRIKRNYPADLGLFGPCPVCQRSFKSSKALHGHMRCHPDRAWRGMMPPEQLEPQEGAEFRAKTGFVSASTAGGSGAGSTEWPFKCRGCGSSFRTKQALGGHRASHKSKQGCYMRSRNQELQVSQGENIAPTQAITTEIHAGANSNINNNNSNVGAGNNGGGGDNRREGLEQGSGIVDLNLPPPQEEEEEKEAGEEIGRLK